MISEKQLYINYKELSEKADALLIQAGVDKAPVPIKQIAAMCGAIAVPHDLGEEVSGVLVVDKNNGNKGIIGFNTANSKVRQRFTIAHELGHFVWHVNFKNNSKEFFVDKDFIIKFRSEKDYTQKELIQEREANAFAAAILMPRKFIMDELKNPNYKGLHETVLIEKLAKVFVVSVPAMTYRLSDLNIYRY